MYSQPVSSLEAKAEPTSPGSSREQFVLVGTGGDSVLIETGSGPCTATAADASRFTSQWPGWQRRKNLLPFFLEKL